MTETWLWLVVNAAGALFCARNLVRALRSRDAARHLEPAYLPEANQRVRLDAVRLMTLLAFVAAAVLALIGGQRQLVIGLLMVGALGVTLNSALDDWHARQPMGERQ